MPDSPTSPYPLQFTLPPHELPLRLDAALALQMPHLGIRARRRLWNWCRILVNGRARAPGFLVNAGDTVRIEAKDANIQSITPCARGIALRELTPDYAILDKPCGLHSAHIAASPAPSLEGLLPGLWPDLHRQWLTEQGLPTPTGSVPAPLCLLTRLDGATSGLLVAARHERAMERFRRDEERGLVQKTYLALVLGVLDGVLNLQARLGTADRVKSLVLDEDDPDPSRHSHVQALGCARLEGAFVRFDEQGPCTLTSVRIKRGARHQIRAHLAAAGFPLAGEWLYADAEAGERRLYLHHAQLEMPGLKARSLPPWLECWPKPATF